MITVLFRGGPIDGLQFEWKHAALPDMMRGFMSQDENPKDVPPVGILEYHRTDWFISDMAPQVKAVIYAWNRK